MSTVEDFRCFCGEPFRVDDPADGFWPPTFVRWPGLREEDTVGAHCPECGTDLGEAYLEQIEQEERAYGKPWADMVNCGGIVTERKPE